MLSARKKLLTSSMEDYLEMIYRICSRDGYIRMTQLSEKLNVRPSSSTKIVQKLSLLGIVDYERYGMVKLTEEGREIGKFLLQRHGIVEEFLKNLGIRDTLLKDTEMLEHDMSIKTMERIHMLNHFFCDHPDILARFHRYTNEFRR